VILSYFEGESVPPIPADAPRCALCGEVHAITIQFVEVTGDKGRASEQQCEAPRS
jgi:hypothetical protein